MRSNQSTYDTFCRPLFRDGQWYYGAAAREIRLRLIGGVDGAIAQALAISELVCGQADMKARGKRPALRVVSGGKKAA